MTTDETIVRLVKEDPDDEALTLRALRRANLTEIVVVRDGVEALQDLFGDGGWRDMG